MTTSLNEALEHRAATASDAAPVLAAVHAGIRRRRRNRTTALTATSALAVGGLLCAAVLLPRHTDPSASSTVTVAGQPTAPSAAGQSASGQGASGPSASGPGPSSPGTAVGTSNLVTIAPAPAAVALSLTRVPAGFGYLGQARADVSAWGPSGTPLVGEFGNKLVAYTAEPASAPATFTTTAAGHPAAVTNDGTTTSVVLELTDEVRVVVQFPDGFEISADDALQVADSLDVRRVVAGGAG